MDSEEGRDPGIGRESPSVPPPPAVPAIASSQLPRGESHPVAVDGSGSPSRQASGSPASARQGEAEEVDDGEGGLGLETRRQVAGRVIRDAAKWLVGKWDPNVNVFGLWRNREARRQRLPVLDGVRTLALAWIFAAVIYSSVVFEGGRLQFPVASQFALNADLAVDLLLLVSGTAVTAAILAEVEDARSFDVLRFYWRRLLSLWPPLAIGLLLTVTFVQDAEVSCSRSWWAVLLFINNIYGDQRCMPQTWLIAVLFQLYVITPAITFACVNYFAVSLRRLYSGYILIYFMSLVSVAIAWIIYEVFAVDSGSGQWPPGIYFDSILLRWTPYLAGVAGGLLLWDQSMPYEDTQKEERKRTNMPMHEEIEERRPILAAESTQAVLDYLLDFGCLVIVLTLGWTGVQEMGGFLATVTRVWFSWSCSRLLFRLLKGSYPAAARILSAPICFTFSQLAYCTLTLQAVIYLDAQSLFGPGLRQEIAAGLISLLFYTVVYGASSFLLYMMIAKPFLRMRPWKYLRKGQASTEDPNPHGHLDNEEVVDDMAGDQKIPKPLQRHRSGIKMSPPSSFGSLSGETITIRSGTRSAMQTFRGDVFPAKGVQYFSAASPDLDYDDAYWVNCVVTAYNEGGEDMADTLISLHNNIVNLRKGTQVHFLIVFDGWSKVSSSMKSYLKRLYPGDDAEQQAAAASMEKMKESPQPRWMDEIDMIYGGESRKAGVPVTFTLQQMYGDVLAPVDVAPGKLMFVSCIIKMDNRRKHNSHDWFLRGFSQQYLSSYLYLTDVGTTSHPLCMARLIKYMERNVDCCAVTGFQRVQKLKPGATLLNHLTREVQAYELGPGNGAAKASQALVGYVAILPGPCQLLRTSDALEPTFLDSFFDFINRDASECGILEANMQLTEDMIFGSFLYSASGSKKTGFVPDAYYDYDVEVANDRFMKQRRRWHNGIFGGLLGRMGPAGDVWSVSMSPLRRAATMAVVIQQCIFVGQYLFLPSIIMYNIFAALGGFKDTLVLPSAYPFLLPLEILLRPLQAAAPYLGVLGYFGVLTGWVVAHNRYEYIPWFYYTMLVLMLGVGIGNIALGINFVLDIRASDNTPLAIVIASITGFSLAGPVISSLALFDVYGLLVSIVNAPFFLAFSPMWVLMGAYGISRFADLSWGNRPHESRSAAAAHRDAYMKTTSVLGMAYMALYLSANLFTGVLLICFGFLWQGTGVVLFFLLIGPYCLSSVFAVIYNMQYAARYRWCTWISARTRQRMMKSRATSTPALSDIPGKSSWR